MNKALKHNYYWGLIIYNLKLVQPVFTIKGQTSIHTEGKFLSKCCWVLGFTSPLILNSFHCPFIQLDGLQWMLPFCWFLSVPLLVVLSCPSYSSIVSVVFIMWRTRLRETRRFLAVGEMEGFSSKNTCDLQLILTWLFLLRKLMTDIGLKRKPPKPPTFQTTSK